MMQLTVILLAAAVAFSSETMKGAKKDFETMKQELSLKLVEAETKLEELKTKAKINASAAKETTIKEAEQTRDQIRKNIEELKDDGKSGWKKMKAGLAASIENMNTKIQKALKD